ncbi:MAG: 7-cyano-7-deazaguanine synthase [Nitrososphaerota archaeon]
MSVVAVVSGGPDSIGYAAIWKARGKAIHPISFSYGQKGVKEVSVMKKLSKRLGFSEPVTVDISSLASVWRGTQLTDEKVSVEQSYRPNVVVPLRNGVFLMIAAAYADGIKAEGIIYGAHLSDAALRADVAEPLYPDCTPEFTRSLETAINRGRFSSSKIWISSPAVEAWSKAELLKRAYDVMGDAIYETWSCYLSGEVHCGRCESCMNRKKAFKDAGIEDKTKYQA